MITFSVVAAAAADAAFVADAAASVTAAAAASVAAAAAAFAAAASFSVRTCHHSSSQRGVMSRRPSLPNASQPKEAEILIAIGRHLHLECTGTRDDFGASAAPVSHWRHTGPAPQEWPKDN